MKYLLCLTLIFGALFGPQHLFAQEEKDPFADAFFDPELVMENMKEIGLSSENRNLLIEEITDAQKTFTVKQFDLLDKMEVLVEMTHKDKIDEKAVLSKLEEVLEIEKQIKVAQLMLMVRIKNLLTPKQQQMLREIQKRG